LTLSVIVWAIGAPPRIPAPYADSAAKNSPPRKAA
jgi:hypothetical protein